MESRVLCGSEISVGNSILLLYLHSYYHFIIANSAITLEELLSRGVTFDMKRYCAPYIRDHVITDLFGPDDFDFAVREYLEQHEDGTLTNTS